jgi:hypothetical protein
MTHITDIRAIGNHADMGGPTRAVPRKSSTVVEILRMGARRRTRGTEMASAESAWDSEGGAAERDTANREGGPAPGGAVGSPQTPTHLVH